MSPADSTDSHRPRPTVFLSYASEDREAAQIIRDALPALGLEVWQDESGLIGGDAWDQKIRRQIRECDYFMPIVSAQTEARHEGYFRREWRFAVERTLDMADDHVFLLPVVVDDTDETRARVPEKFLAVQWSRLPGGHPTPQFEALCRRLACGKTVALSVPRRSPDLPTRADRRASRRALRHAAQRALPEFPEFPREEPGQKIRFWVQVAGWAVQSAWTAFMRLPKWVRALAYLWVAVAVLSRGCTPSEHHARNLSPAEAEKLKEITQNYHGSLQPADLAKLGAQIAQQEGSADAGGESAGPAPLLAVPFSAPSGDAAAHKLADTTFAQVYGRIALTRHGRVSLTDAPLSSLDSSAALTSGRAHHSSYVVYRIVDSRSGVPNLTVQIASVTDGSVLWSKSYPVAGADPAQIAAEVDSNVPKLEND